MPLENKILSVETSEDGKIRINYVVGLDLQEYEIVFNKEQLLSKLNNK